MARPFNDEILEPGLVAGVGIRISLLSKFWNVNLTISIKSGRF